jgi:hypothetical protein
MRKSKSFPRNGFVVPLGTGLSFLWERVCCSFGNGFVVPLGQGEMFFGIYIGLPINCVLLPDESV